MVSVGGDGARCHRGGKVGGPLKKKPDGYLKRREKGQGLSSAMEVNGIINVIS